MKKELPEIVSTLGTLTVGYRLFGWTVDSFHLAVGLVVLGGLVLLTRWVKQRRRRTPLRTHKPARGQLMVRGVMKGTICLGLAGSIFHLVAAYSPTDCPDVLQEMATLRQAEAWQGMVARIDTHLEEKIGPDCRANLLRQEFHALVRWAKPMLAQERMAKLVEAQHVATALRDTELHQHITAELQATQAEVASAQQREELALRDTIIQWQRQALVRNQTLLAKLRERQFEVWETRDGVVVRLPDDSLFAVSRADLTAAARTSVRQLAAVLNHADVKDRHVRIEGHTDASGTEEGNNALSEDRAQSVTDMLVRAGVSQARLVVKGLGAAWPIAPNNTPAGRAQNRRVEITILNAREGANENLVSPRRWR